MRSEAFEHWSAVLTVAAGLVAAVCGYGIYYFGKRVQGEKEVAAQKRERELRERLDTVRDYTETAKLNFVGTTGAALPPLVESTPISRSLEGAVDISENRSRYHCDSKSLETFKQLMSRFPRFPFSYYALAFCLRENGDEDWTGYAKEAVGILKRTTSIDGHHPNHDQALRELQESLQERRPRKVS